MTSFKPKSQNSAPAAKETLEDLDHLWREFAAKHREANFLQSPAWARASELAGHRAIIEHFGAEAWCLMLVRNARRGRYLEIPCGPLLDWRDAALVRRMFALIRKTAKRERCVFVRLRPQIRLSDTAQNPSEKPQNPSDSTQNALPQSLLDLSLKKAPMHLAAEHTVILDLSKSEDDLLKEMRRQTRYEVRRAAKLGITVTSGNSEALFREFHEVQAATAARQHFVPPSLATLLAERTAFGDNAQIYVARAPETDAPIAYGLILISENEAAYYEAASTELNHRLPGAYALEWQVIRDLKARGIPRYNLWGIAPPGDPKHRYAGVTTFKTGFGGEIVEFLPAQDLVIDPLRYPLDWLVETARKKKRHL